MAVATPPPRDSGPLAGKAFKPPRLGFGYRLSLLFVAAGMVGLVVVYLLLVAAAIAALVAHTVFNHSWIFIPAEPVFQVLMAFLYGSGIGLGILLVLFLLKPLVARKPGHHDGRYFLSPKTEPRFHAFVHELADFLKAKRPRQIIVELDPNASAGYGLGMFSVLFGRMELSVGLPLVAGMTQRQLAGIIAHELGHFTQGSAGRLGYLVFRLQAWFGGMIYDDEWDAALKRWTEEWGPFGLIPLMARGLVWCTRRVLYLFFLSSLYTSRFMARQREFHADAYKAAIAGSEGFEETMRQITLLDFATNFAMGGNREAWREQRLVDDLPGYIIDHIDELPAEGLQAAFAELERKKTRWWETHPAFPERVARVHALGEPGLYENDGPAAELFSDFPELCRAVTKTYYKQLFGKRFEERFVAKRETVLKEQRAGRESFRAASRYFQGVFNNVDFPLLLQAELLRPPDDPAHVVEQLREARSALQAAVPRITEARRRFVEGSHGVVDCEAAVALMKGEVRLAPNTFGLAKPTRASAETKMRESHIARNGAKEELSRHARQCENRLLGALALLHMPQVQERMKADPLTAQDAEGRLRNFAHVCFVLDLVGTLREKTAILAVLLQCIPTQGLDANHALSYRIRDYIAEVNKYLNHVIQPLRANGYPYPHSAGAISIADYALREMPHPYDLEAVFSASRRLTENVYTLYFRLLAELTGMAARVEQLVGLPPLPEPVAIEEEEAVLGE